MVDPISLANLMDTLPTEKVTFDIERFDEFASLGTGHDIASEMAAPKWVASIEMRDGIYNADARAMAARIRALNGSQIPFMVYDPSHKYPASDPGGALVTGETVQINSIGADNHSLSLKGLPDDYVITIGDKGQILFASGTRNYYFEFSASIVADALGVTNEVDVFPHIPIGVVEDATVILIKPACKMIVTPKGFNPGQSSGNMTYGASLSVIEKI